MGLDMFAKGRQGGSDGLTPGTTQPIGYSVISAEKIEVQFDDVHTKHTYRCVVEPANPESGISYVVFESQPPAGEGADTLDLSKPQSLSRVEFDRLLARNGLHLPKLNESGEDYVEYLQRIRAYERGDGQEDGPTARNSRAREALKSLLSKLPRRPGFPQEEDPK